MSWYNLLEVLNAQEKVWTPNALRKFLLEMGAVISGNHVSVPMACLVPRRQRGGDGSVSGYKINSLFFVRIGDCEVENGIVTFPLGGVRQLNQPLPEKYFLTKILIGRSQHITFRSNGE